MIKKLNAHPYAQANIIIRDNYVALVSYNTTVAICENGWLTVYGLYSATTRKHIGAFMREMGYGDYYTAKRIFGMGVRYNVETGEIENL